jgi:hypothetical protein
MWDLLPIVDDKEVGQKYGNNRFIEGFEVGSFPKEFFQKLFAMHQKGVKVLSGCNIGKKSEGGYLDFDEAELTLFVGRVANDGCWRSRKVVMNHQAKKVLQGGGAWGNRTKGGNAFGLYKL